MFIFVFPDHCWCYCPLDALLAWHPLPLLLCPLSHPSPLFLLLALQCPLHTLHIAHCTLHTAHCILHNVPLHCTLCNEHCILSHKCPLRFSSFTLQSTSTKGGTLLLCRDVTMVSTASVHSYPHYSTALLRAQCTHDCPTVSCMPSLLTVKKALCTFFGILVLC